MKIICSDNEFKIKRISGRDISEALNLVWEVFLQFETPQYSKEGIDEFYNFINNKSEIEKLDFYGAFDGGKITGVLAMRKQHISLFFVKADYHRKGIGRKLFKYMKKDYEIQSFTVNSAPYAYEFYRRLGFESTDTEKITNGIRYIPMNFKKRGLKKYET